MMYKFANNYDKKIYNISYYYVKDYLYVKNKLYDPYAF